MPRRKKQGPNKHQKAAHRPGEERVGRELVEQLLELSHSADPVEREHAASFLCPCHVRRRIDEVWDALFRMMEDDDVQVRRAAWHTLEDGGSPDDPRLDRIIDNLWQRETDRQVRNYLKKYTGERRKKADLEFKLAGHSEFDLHGRCDFCGQGNTAVKRDLDTFIPDGNTNRAGLICESCAGQPA